MCGFFAIDEPLVEHGNTTGIDAGTLQGQLHDKEYMH